MKNAGKRRIVIWSVLVLVAAALLVTALAPRPVPVDLEAAARGGLQVTLDHEGKTRVRDLYVISAPLAGRVRRIELEPGDRVAAGETVLVTFEPRASELLDARSHAEASAVAKAAEATLARTRAERERAQAEMEFAATELARAERLAVQGIVSGESLDAAAVEARVRREALEAARSAEQSARYDLEAARSRLLEPEGAGQPGPTARWLELRSPVDGLVLRRLRESEAVVPMGEPLLEVADPANLEVVADFLSTDAVRIRAEMPVLIDQWGGDVPLRGRVRRIEPSGFMKISALGVEEQRVNVIVDFDDPQEAWAMLGDGYRVEVRVVVWESDDVLQVPVSSLFRWDVGWAAFVEDGGRARLQTLSVGRRNGLHAEVLDGVEAGRRVVIHPSDAVVDGVRITER